MEIEAQWKEIFGEKMPPDVLNRVLKIQKAMNLKDDDGIWQILIPLEFYQRLHEQIPGSMRKESETILGQIKSASADVLRETAGAVVKIQEQAVIDIGIEREKAKTALAKALDTTMPGKIKEATDAITTAVEKSKGRKFWGEMASIGIGIGIAFVIGIGAYDMGKTAQQHPQPQQQRFQGR